MDRIFSARLDEAVVYQIGMLAEQLETSKKAVIERAVHALTREVTDDGGEDVIDRTLGAWKRDESPSETVTKGRDAFRRSMERHRR